MPPHVATVVCAAFIAGLFWLDRERKAGISAALWIAVIWVGLADSRSTAQWLNWGAAPIDTGDLQLEGSPVDRVVYSVLLAAGLIVLITRAGKTKRVLRVNAPVLIFFLYCLVSLVWSDFPDVAFKRWLKAIGDLVMVLVVWTEVDPQSAVQRLLQRITYLLMPLSILLIKYYPEMGRVYGRWFGEVHYTGVTTNKNTLGAICLLSGLATLWRLLALYRNRRQTGRRRMLIANGVILGIILWLLSMADSMTSWACFAMGGSLVLAMNLRSIARRRGILHFIVPVMLLVCVSILFLGVSPTALSAMGKNPTLTDRTEMWSLLLSLRKSSFVGTGFASYWLGPRLAKIWSVWEWKPTQAHNGYLEIYLNLGWVGVVLLALVLVTGYRNVFLAWRRNAFLGSLLLPYFVVGIAYNFTEAAFFQMLYPVWILLLLAMVGHAALVSPRYLGSANRASHWRNELKSSRQPSPQQAVIPMEAV